MELSTHHNENCEETTYEKETTNGRCHGTGQSNGCFPHQKSRDKSRESIGKTGCERGCLGCHGCWRGLRGPKNQEKGQEMTKLNQIEQDVEE